MDHEVELRMFVTAVSTADATGSLAALMTWPARVAPAASAAAGSPDRASS